MILPLKTLSQLPLVLKGFRKEKGLTQAAMAERLGITQQSYAYFEANPAKATLERLFMVLRLLDVEISLDQTIGKAPGTTVTIRKEKPAAAGAMPPAVVKPARIVATTRKKESW